MRDEQSYSLVKEIYWESSEILQKPEKYEIHVVLILLIKSDCNSLFNVSD